MKTRFTILSEMLKSEKELLNEIHGKDLKIRGKQLRAKILKKLQNAWYVEDRIIIELYDFEREYIEAFIAINIDKLLESAGYKPTPDDLLKLSALMQIWVESFGYTSDQAIKFGLSLRALIGK